MAQKPKYTVEQLDVTRSKEQAEAEIEAFASIVATFYLTLIEYGIEQGIALNILNSWVDSHVARSKRRLD